MRQSPAEFEADFWPLWPLWPFFRRPMATATAQATLRRQIAERDEALKLQEKDRDLKNTQVPPLSISFNGVVFLQNMGTCFLPDDQSCFSLFFFPSKDIT